MPTILTFLVLVVFAYLGAHFLVGHLQSRYLFATGAQYMLLGFLIGPELPILVAGFVGEPLWTGFLDREVLRQLAPLVSLAIGWAGLAYGMEFELRRMVNARDGSVSLAFVQSAVTFVTIYLLSRWLLSSLLVHLPPEQANPIAMLLGATAAVSSPDAIDLLRRRFGADGRHTLLLARSCRLDELMAIFAFGLIFCLYHPQAVLLDRAPAATEWYVLTIALGAMMGVIFHFFLGEEEHEDKLFLALVGIIVFTAGAAYYLELSPLLANLVLGMVLTNTSRHAPQLRAVIEGTRKPMALVLLTFAGALWTTVPLPGLALAAAYLVARWGAKLLGGWLGAISVDQDIRRDVGRGLLSHGEVAAAMALNFRLVYEYPAASWAFTAVLGSMLVNEMVSVRFLKGLFIDSGDISMGASRAGVPSGQAVVIAPEEPRGVPLHGAGGKDPRVTGRR